jgi:hypothetical protein
MRVVARCSMWVRERSQLCEQSFVRESGEPWARLDVGEDREVSMYGPPAAMRRLGAAVMAAADTADELAHEHARADQSAQAA